MGTKGSSATAASQLDVVLDGTWVIVPRVDANNNIVRVDVYSPACGHPQGVYFTNQLNLTSAQWPEQNAFYMLDSHSYTLQVQRGSRAPTGIPVSKINTSVNHCVSVARPIGSNWDLLLTIAAGPDGWGSADTIDPHTTDPHGNTVACLSGDDAPTGKISSMQTLSFTGVTAVALLGAPKNVQSLFPAPWSGNGTMIFEDEVPYIPTLQHERAAIFSMANLAGLDLALDYPLPATSPGAPAGGGPPRPKLHSGGFCGHSLIVMPS